jgi:hypothetical protein
MRRGDWIQRIHSFSGTIVSAGVETIQLYPFGGVLKNLALAVSEKHDWVPYWRQQGLTVFCLEEHTGQPEKNTGRLLEHNDTLAFLKQCRQPVYVLMFKPDARSWNILKKAGFHVLGCHPSIARRLENKLLFPSIATASGVLLPETRPIAPDKTGRLPENPESRNISFPFVCQFAKGFSGNRTFLVNACDDWQSLVDHYQNRSCRISRLIDGDTWTANACLFKNGHVVVSPPFLQETLFWKPKDGLPTRIGSAGNRWGQFSDDVSRHVKRVVSSIGNSLFNKGFHGFFGVDLMCEYDTGKWVAIEVNPRLTASATVLTSFEQNGDAPPVAASHIAASLGMDWFDAIPETPPAGGQRIYRPGGLPLPFASEQHLNGIYRWNGAELTDYRFSADPANLANNELFVWKPSRQDYFAENMRIIYRGQYPF